MTAIAGFWSFDGRPAGEACARMLQAQAPYGQHIARADAFPISLGRNLYAMLPEDSYDRGPLERGPYKFVADVRIDNRAEMAEAVGISPRALARTSDSELLFEALLKWGDEAPDRIAGEFAFALWNGEDQSLLLGRDILGHRPVHYHRGRDFFAFSTMPSGLHALPAVPREIDSEFMAESLALFPRWNERTQFKSIEQVQHAHVARVTRNGVSQKRYWRPDLSPLPGRSEEFEQGLRAVVDQAVSAQLRGSGEAVASHLSAGLDSSIITSTAARLIDPGRVVAFTGVPRKGFDGPIPSGAIANEAELAAATAAQFSNVEHVLIESSSGSAFAELDREHYYHQEPLGNLCNAVWGRQILRVASERGLKVLLQGNAGNLTVSYSGMEWLSQLMARGKVVRAIRNARSLSANGVPWRTLGAQLVGPFLPDFAWRLACRLYGRPTELKDYTAVGLKHWTALDGKARSIGFDHRYKPMKDPAQLRLSVLLEGDAGNYYKGVLAQWGISARDPLTDKRLIEYCLRVPAEEFVRGGVLRSLARRAFEDRLPRQVASFTGRGYQSADWYETIARDMDSLRQETEAIARCAEASEALDVEWLRRSVASWPTGKVAWERNDISFRYRYGMLRAVAAGHFMRKVAGTN